MERDKPKSSESYWEVFRRPSVIGVFILVGCWNLSIESVRFAHLIEGQGAIRETAREIRDVNLHLQLRFYHLLTLLRPIPFRPDHVSLAYIDDDLHWTALYGDLPTNREYLARLVENASQIRTRAAAIGIDIELLAPRHFPDGSDAQSRFTENQALLKAIQFAAAQGVPVILGSVFITSPENESKELPNIFSESDLQGSSCREFRCPAFGFINLPDDKRQIPLLQQVRSASDPDTYEAESFSLALANAVREPMFRADPLPPEIGASDKSVFGTFLSEDRYPKISVANLANGDITAERECAGRIVLIGGHWHDVQGYGEPLDQHLSPVGYLSGLGLHANYIESLLQHQYTHNFPAWVDVLFDVIVGILIYVGYERAAFRWWQKLMILAVASVLPFMLAWFALDMLNRYVDCLFPLELYFIHISYEVLQRHFTWQTVT